MVEGCRSEQWWKAVLWRVQTQHTDEAAGAGGCGGMKESFFEGNVHFVLMPLKH